MTDAHADKSQPSTSSSNTPAEVVGYLHKIAPLKKGAISISRCRLKTKQFVVFVSLLQS